MITVMRMLQVARVFVCVCVLLSKYVRACVYVCVYGCL